MVRAGLLQTVTREIALRLADESARADAPAHTHQNDFETGEEINRVEGFARRNVTEHGGTAIERRKTHCPAIGGMIPRIVLIRVDLPEPFAPSKPVKPPRTNFKLMFSKTGWRS